MINDTADYDGAIIISDLRSFINSVVKQKLVLFIIYFCMQDSFARTRTRPKAARPSARATIGYLVYNIYLIQ